MSNLPYKSPYILHYTSTFHRNGKHSTKLMKLLALCKNLSIPNPCFWAEYNFSGLALKIQASGHPDIIDQAVTFFAFPEIIMKLHRWVNSIRKSVALM